MTATNNKKNALSLKIWFKFYKYIKKKTQFYLELSNDIAAKVNWVYGYRCNDVVKSIEYIPPLHKITFIYYNYKTKRIGGKSATEKLIYFTANIVIIYYPKLNE